MALLVDTSVWSLAFRRDTPSDSDEVQALRVALQAGEDVYTCGVIVLELRRGLIPGRARDAIDQVFRSVSWIEPSRDEYEAAAEIANTCRRHRVQLGSIDALVAELAVSRDLTLLTTDGDFAHAAAHVPLRLWSRP
ncbi:PIN domain-containing protein [Microbacterium sp.]|uniref:PIN domain-containing protein n=1 Tax=Microbacterium sp. TaxID=51671 RepID=UPI003A8ECFAC